MADVFKEYLIKQKKTSMDYLAQIGLVIAAIILVVAAFLLGGDFLGPIVIIGVVFGTGFLMSKFSREYEYILTNNELDIDVIYNRNRRKRVMTIDMKKIDIMASITDKNHQAELQKGVKLINASDNNNDASTYAIITQNPEKGACKVLISPNEQFLTSLYKQAPNKVFK